MFFLLCVRNLEIIVELVENGLCSGEQQYALFRNTQNFLTFSSKLCRCNKVFIISTVFAVVFVLTAKLSSHVIITVCHGFLGLFSVFHVLYVLSLKMHTKCFPKMKLLLNALKMVFILCIESQVKMVLAD